MPCLSKIIFQKVGTPDEGLFKASSVAELQSSDVWRKHCIKCPQRNDQEHLPRLTRGRKPRACEQCSRSKVTCDKTEPCGRCESRQLTCNYGRLRHDRPRRTSSFGTTTPDGVRWKSGAMFLLSLTDPAATSMLESFTDDPSDINSDNASAISIEEAPFQEDDIFLQSLCDFVFDPLPTEMDDIHGPAVAGDIASQPAAHIFRPQAYAALQDNADSAVADLRTLHLSLVSKDASYDEPFGEASVRQALSADSLIRFTTTYFQRSHHHIPIVHRQSFGSHDTATTLLLAVAHAGALRSPPRDDALVIRGLARLFEEYIFRRLEDMMSTYGVSASPLESKWLLETLQAAILINNVQLMINNVATRRRIRTRRHPILVSAVRRLGPFAIRHSPHGDGTQYLHEESCIR